MTRKLGLREGAVSCGICVAVLLGLTFVDPRVHDAISDLFSSGAVSPFGDRLGDAANALWMAARYQSIDNAPLLVFTVVGSVLTLFMFRS